MKINYIDSDSGLSIEVHHGNFNDELPCKEDIVCIDIQGFKRSYEVSSRRWQYYESNETRRLSHVDIYLTKV